MLKKTHIIIATCILIPVLSWLFAQTSELSGDGRIPFFDPDVLLYVRWLEQSILSGKTISFDSYSCFPTGYEIRVPPLLMGLMTQTILAVHALVPGAGAFQPEWLAGILPPLAYAFLIFIAFGIAKWKTGGLLVPIFVIVGAFPGIAASHCFDALRLDHHFLEAFFLWMFIFSGWLFIDTGKEFLIILGGLMGGGLLLSSLSAPLYFLIICLITGIFWAGAWSHADRTVEFGKSAMLIAGGMGIIYLIWHPPTGSWKRFNEFQWLQPLCLVAGGCFHALLQRLSDYSRDRRLFLAVMAVCGIGILFQEGVKEIPFMRDAFSLLFNKNRLMATISELQPIGSLGGPDGQIRYQQAWYAWFGCVVLFLPLVFRNTFGLWSGGGRFGFISLMSILVLGSAQRRWLRLLGPGQALLAGSILAELFRTLSRKKNGENEPCPPDPLAFATMAIVIMVQLGVSWHSSAHWNFPSAHIIEAAEWLERNSPPTSGYSDEGKPEYGVLTMWDHGNSIAYYARRPVIANNMQLGIVRLADVFTAASERDALDACRKYGIRYLFMTDLSGRAQTIDILNEYKMNAGRAIRGEYLDLGWQTSGVSRNIEYDKTFYCWAYEMMSFFSTPAFREGASNFRLIFASKNDWTNPVPAVLIFKVVDGALLKGRADPGSHVTVSLDCRVSMAPVRYRKSVRAGDDGAYEVRVAYPTGYAVGRITTGSDYDIVETIGNKKVNRKIRVSEADVDAGSVMDIK